jgi:hypothetical protein
MFSGILSALTVVRHAVAITLVTGAATTMVAGSLDVSGSHPTTNLTASSSISTTASTSNTSGELAALVKACLATEDPQSAECAQAIDKSGTDAPAFWAAVAMSLQEQLKRATAEHVTGTPKPEPTAKPESDAHPITSELLGLVAACVESHERSSDACTKAVEASGLSADEFYAKVAARFGKPTEPTTTPNDAGHEGLSILVRDCLVTYETARKTNATGEAAGETCRKAIAASGLSARDFWVRFGPKTTRTEPTHKPASTTKPTAKPEATSPTGVQTVSDEQLAAMVKDCFAKYLVAKETKEGGTAAYEACTKAITASGLGGDAFWKKFGTPGAATN